jgi:predicted DCC family thiol-disulfide oxidoreductase YuxK
MSPPRYPLTIYYDASCPLCAAEMHALRDSDRRGCLELIDCSVPGFEDEAVAAAGIKRADLMRLIHARDADDRWYRAVDVFVLAYAAVGIEAIAGVWSHPRLRPVWDRLYPWVARHRMLLSRCRLSASYGWLVRRAARRATRRSSACNIEA